jgi:hypothetical protein
MGTAERVRYPPMDGVGSRKSKGPGFVGSPALKALRFRRDQRRQPSKAYRACRSDEAVVPLNHLRLLSVQAA